jgi:hypothetical protein
VAVLAVFGERLSRFKFPDLQENTGNFADGAAETDLGCCFSHHKSDGYPGIPYASEQGILARQQRIFSEVTGIALAFLARLG